MATFSIHYTSPDKLCWSRKKNGENFQYSDEHGKSLPAADIDRIKKLVIPPAWENVQICPDQNGHIQAVGTDARGRKQYIYHPDWIAHNQQHKFESLVRFGEILPTLRETLAGHMRERTLTKERVLATVVWLLEHTFIRIGSQVYAHDNQSYGLTTLREKHVDVENSTVSFSFKGKSGIYHELDVSHPRIAKTIQACIDLPGYEVFQYLDDSGQRQIVDSRDVNEYLHSITGEQLSAKEFRTWGGTVLAGNTLYSLGPWQTETESKKFLRSTVKDVAGHLRNTVAVCRKYYIHPAIIKHHQNQTLVPHFEKMFSKHANEKFNSTNLSLEELATWELLKK